MRLVCDDGGFPRQGWTVRCCSLSKSLSDFAFVYSSEILGRLKTEESRTVPLHDALPTSLEADTGVAAGKSCSRVVSNYRES
jgi:hypothetical protein